MSRSAEVHTLLAVNEYRVTSDAGVDIDADTTLVTRRRGYTFRGSLAQLCETFSFGTGAEVPESQTRMFCSGPRNVRLVPGTEDDPHWDFEVEHIGLHTAVHNSAYAIWRVTPNWTTRETQLPYTTSDGSTTYNALTPLVPSAVSNTLVPCLVIDHEVSVEVRGILYTGQSPHPQHPYILAIVARLATVVPSSVIVQNTFNYSTLGNGYQYCKNMPAGTTTSNNTVGVWQVGDISADAVYEPMDGTVGPKVYDVRFPVTWRPRKVLA